MSAEALAAISSIQAHIVEPSLQPLANAEFSPSSSLAASATGFGDLVTQGLGQVNQQLMTNQTDLQQLAVGDVQNLHQIMIRMEETRLSFQLVMQVRNRMLEAYQDVMKMQV